LPLLTMSIPPQHREPALSLFTSKGAAGVTAGAFGALAATVVATGVVPVEGLASGQ
jgi:Na+/H+-dicarboxylate symporter